MDKIITGVIGIVLFVLFAGGLAVSIHQIPFTVIVVIISIMAIYGLYEELRSGDD